MSAGTHLGLLPARAHAHTQTRSGMVAQQQASALPLWAALKVAVGFVCGAALVFSCECSGLGLLCATFFVSCMYLCTQCVFFKLGCPCEAGSCTARGLHLRRHGDDLDVDAALAHAANDAEVALLTPRLAPAVLHLPVRHASVDAVPNCDSTPCHGATIRKRGVSEEAHSRRT